jgi:predicted N-formylglutamate amidohydrolase
MAGWKMVQKEFRLDAKVGPLLQSGFDLPPAEVINPNSTHQILLACEHAGLEVPQSLDRLGLPSDAYGLHVSHDIGAENVARQLAEKLGSTLVMQRYSRLVIDCNRPPGSASSIPEISDDVFVPGNAGISDLEKRQRRDEIFAPFSSKCRHHIAQPHISAAFSIHSFTPVMANKPRPWDIGFLYRTPESKGLDLANLCASTWPDLLVGYNEPYGIADDGDWFIPVCAEPRQIPHCLVEIRNDLISSDSDCAKWADRLQYLFTKILDNNNV